MMGTKLGKGGRGKGEDVSMMGTKLAEIALCPMRNTLRYAHTDVTVQNAVNTRP